MNIESLTPFLLIIAPFFIAFLLEALVIYFFKLRQFWPSVGISFLINLLALLVLYVGCLLLTKIGYELNVLQFPIQVTLFLWWLSMITDGILLQLLSRREEKKRIYLTSIVMNSVSYLFLYFFISNSH
jgi:hypothetical protein